MSFVCDSTPRTIQVFLAAPETANKLQITGAYVDWSQSLLTTTSKTPISTQTNGTSPVTVVPAPAAGTSRDLVLLNIANDDTAAATITVDYNDNSTLRHIIYQLTLSVGDTLVWSEDRWYTMTNTGSSKGLGTVGATGATGATGPAGGGTGDIVILQDQETQNTGGGAFTNGSWQTRVLNTVVKDTGSNVASLSGNQFVLSAGTYEIDAIAPASAVDRHQLRLYNVTSSTVLVIGESIDADSTSPGTQNTAHLLGYFTVAASQTLALQHQCQTTNASNGLGVPANFTTETYATVKLRKVGSGAVGSAGVNVQTGTTYTFVQGDQNKLVTGTNSGAQAYALPQAGSSGNFANGWMAKVENRGAGTMTITPTTSQIDGAASLALTTNQGIILESDGTNYYTMRGVGGAGGGGNTLGYLGTSNLVITCGGSGSTVAISADAAVLGDASFNSLLFSGISLTPNITSSGINGLDTGSVSASTWYYLWLVGKTGTVGAIYSLSSTTPTMPSGFTFKLLIGANRTDGSSHTTVMTQFGRRVHFPITVVFNNQTGVTSWTSQSISSIVPPIAKFASGICGPSVSTSRGIAVAGDSSGSGAQGWNGGASSNQFLGYYGSSAWDVSMGTPQTIYWQTFAADVSTYRIDVTGYEIFGNLG
jgi:hypothetical protein